MLQTPLFAWKNVCPSASVSYCSNVGKNAYEKPSESSSRKGIKLGKIVGVSWKEKGTIVGFSKNKASTAPEDAYYYIVTDIWGESFLKPCEEIEVVEKE